ncbi:pyridoxal phosphate-dependent aminotransferase [Mycolicibacter minnesotensis]
MTPDPTADPAAALFRDTLPAAVDPYALSLNENPLPPLPAVRAALIESLAAANRYPDFLPTGLRRLVAGHLGVPEKCVAIGPGATELAIRVLHATTRPGERIAMSRPTFDGYPIFAKMTRLTPVEVPLDRYGHHDLDAMARAAADAAVVVLCQPHNPTGTLEPVADVERFIAGVPAETIVLLDEAYIEFAAPQQRSDVRGLIERYPNVVVLRTFSKAYGLAGIRVGYALAAPDLAGALWEMQTPFGIGATCTVAVAASYEAESQLQQRIAHINAERTYLRDRLGSAGIYTTDSHANFLYLPAARRPWTQVFDGTGLRVRHYPDGAVRVTVGSRSSTRLVLSAVERALETPAVAP